jgi:hypothetical protein
VRWTTLCAVDNTAENRIGPWLVTAHWPADAEQGGPRRLVIEAAPDASPDDLAAGLSQTVLRQVRFDALAEQWRAARTADAAVDPAPLLRAAAGHGVTDAYLAALSAAYVHLANEGHPSITAALADMAGKAPETIRIHLKRARQAGMLTAVRGKAGGKLTDKARSLLA